MSVDPMAGAVKVTCEVSAVSEYDYVVINDELDRCVAELRGVVLAERARRDRRLAMIAPIVKTFQ